MYICVQNKSSKRKYVSSIPIPRRTLNFLHSFHPSPPSHLGSHPLSLLIFRSSYTETENAINSYVLPLLLHPHTYQPNSWIPRFKNRKGGHESPPPFNCSFPVPRKSLCVFHNRKAFNYSNLTRQLKEQKRRVCVRPLQIIIPGFISIGMLVGKGTREPDGVYRNCSVPDSCPWEKSWCLCLVYETLYPRNEFIYCSPPPFSSARKWHRYLLYIWSLHFENRSQNHIMQKTLKV